MAGGALHDTWETRADLGVQRRACCEPGCPTRPQYRDDVTGDPLCGPHFRARGLDVVADRLDCAAAALKCLLSDAAGNPIGEEVPRG